MLAHWRRVSPRKRGRQNKRMHHLRVHDKCAASAATNVSPISAIAGTRALLLWRRRAFVCPTYLAAKAAPTRLSRVGVLPPDGFCCWRAIVAPRMVTPAILGQRGPNDGQGCYRDTTVSGDPRWHLGLPRHHGVREVPSTCRAGPSRTTDPNSRTVAAPRRAPHAATHT